MMRESRSAGFERLDMAESAERTARLGDVISALSAMFLRRVGTLGAVSSGVLIVALIAIFLVPSRYVAVTRIRIDPSLNPMSQDQGQALINAEAIETEAGLMSSRALATKVVQKLALDHDPEFASHPLTGKAVSLDQVVSYVMKNLSVNRDQLSYIISLSFKSRDPNRSALIANTFADTYLAMRVRSKVTNSVEQANFFQQRLAELGRNVNDADSRLAAYRASTGLSDNGAGGNVVDQQIATLSAQLATAEAQAASARSNASVADNQVKSGNADSVVGVQGSNTIRDLRSQRADIVRNLGEVEGVYGPRHPESIRVHQQLDGVDRQLQDEARRVVGSLRAEAQADNAQVSSLRSTMSALEAVRARNTRNSADAERLERDAASVRAQFDKMSGLSLESTQAARGSIAQAQIVDRAEPPSRPPSPGKSLLCGLALVGSIGFGLAVVLVLEMAQGGLRTIADAESRLGLPLLASVPQEGAKKGRFRRRLASSPADLIGAMGATLYSESIRNLRASLIGVRQTSGARVIGFTSALPGEGKSTTALAFARMLAVNGARVLLVDGDLRNSKLARSVSISPDGGLINVLRGRSLLADAVTADHTAGLDILAVAKTLFISRDVFSVATIETLLHRCQDRYDYVIMDLPPVLGVADSRTLAVMADLVVFVVRWGSTPLQAASLALSSLRSDGVNLRGVVYTMVDPASEANGSAYYTRNHAKYYQMS